MNNDLLLGLAVVAVVISVIFFGVVYNSVVPLSGYATNIYGTVNVSVESAVSVSFTSSNINFGSGRVDDGKNFSILNSSVGNAVDGNWSWSPQYLIVENIGNENATLNISFGASPANFLGGNAPWYKYTITNSEANSCTASSGNVLGTWYDTSTSSKAICDVFDFNDDRDQISIEISLKIPSDSKTGNLGDVVTITYDVA